MVGLSPRRDAVKVLEGKGVSERRACQLVGLCRATQRYHPLPDGDDELPERIRSEARATAGMATAGLIFASHGT
jgi:putative transposase